MTPRNIVSPYLVPISMYDVNEDNFRIYLRRQEADQVLRQALPRRSHIVERIFPSKIENQENSRDVPAKRCESTASIPEDEL